MSTRQMRSNRPMLLTGRRATLAIAVAALGLGAGSSLAEAADDVATTTEVTAAEVTATESLVIELVIEAPPVEEATAEQPANGQPEGNGTQEDTPDTAVTSEPAPAPEPLAEASPDTEQPVTAALETTTEPPDADHDHEEGEGGHDDGTEGGHDGGEGGHDDGTEGGHDDGTEGGHDDGTEGGHDGGEGGHGGGQQGQGKPYRMTFSVDWRSDDGTPIAALDNMLPDDWRTVFELAAASRTGRNQPTSALCTYESGDQLVCEFDNPGHRSSADGMIVPARPTATYTVTIEWEDSDWTIDGANAGPYSARDLCPRGGHNGGHDGGHEDGHDSGHESLTEGDDGQGGDTFLCEHVVVIQQIAVVTPEPEPPTEPGAPDTDEAQAALSPVAPSSTPTQRTLPATGSSISLMLAIGTALAAIGVGLALLTRRATPDPIGGPGEDRGRMRP